MPNNGKRVKRDAASQPTPRSSKSQKRSNEAETTEDKTMVEKTKAVSSTKCSTHTRARQPGEPSPKKATAEDANSDKHPAAPSLGGHRRRDDAGSVSESSGE